jgi:alpha-D-ribose 1-methylphosphonate 5-triphosphate synthase subunit PhnH
MEMILHRIIYLQASIEETAIERKIEFHTNAKDSDMMQVLSCAIEKLNQLNIHGPRGKLMRFSMT